MPITCVIITSIQTVNPSVFPPIYPSALKLESNWKGPSGSWQDLLGRCDQETWAQWVQLNRIGAFHRHRWSSVEKKEMIQCNGCGKRFPFHKWLLAWMQYKSVQVKSPTFCLRIWGLCWVERWGLQSFTIRSGQVTLKWWHLHET